MSKLTKEQFIAFLKSIKISDWDISVENTISGYIRKFLVFLIKKGDERFNAQGFEIIECNPLGEEFNTVTREYVDKLIDTAYYGDDCPITTEYVLFDNKTHKREKKAEDKNEVKR